MLYDARLRRPDRAAHEFEDVHQVDEETLNVAVSDLFEAWRKTHDGEDPLLELVPAT